METVETDGWIVRKTRPVRAFHILSHQLGPDGVRQQRRTDPAAPVSRLNRKGVHIVDAGTEHRVQPAGAIGSFQYLIDLCFCHLACLEHGAPDGGESSLTVAVLEAFEADLDTGEHIAIEGETGRIPAEKGAGREPGPSDQTVEHRPLLEMVVVGDGVRWRVPATRFPRRSGARAPRRRQ